MDKILGRFKEGWGFKLIASCGYITVFSLVLLFFAITPIVTKYSMSPRLEVMSTILLTYSLICLVFLAALLSAPKKGYLKSISGCSVVVFIFFAVISFDYGRISAYEFRSLAFLFMLLCFNLVCFKVIERMFLPEELCPPEEHFQLSPPGYDWKCSACAEVNSSDVAYCEMCKCPSLVSALDIKQYK